MTDEALKSVNSGRRLNVLDGWRGISILLVLAAHLLPLGPKPWQLNVATGVMGMVLFFILSGFLITNILLKKPSIPEFLLRRFFRIVPLASLYLAIALFMAGATFETWISHFLFYANLPPAHLVPLTEHMWSVCVEMQFYVGVAVLVAAFKLRGLMLLPVLCISFTVIRMFEGIHASSITYFRVDEILAGCTLALIYNGRLGEGLLRFIRGVPQIPVLLLLAFSCHDYAGWLNYFRPYLAAVLIGATLLNPGTSLVIALNRRVLGYAATISYALYVIHPLLAASWLGSGDVFVKYAKRPVLFVALLLLAHLSTYYYERRWTAFGRRLTDRINLVKQQQHNI